MKKIRIAGVPEHFNLPWRLAIETDKFAKQGIEMEWKVFPGGTGAMTKALRNNETDIAVLLTEGAVADIIKGNPSKIIGQYIASPLIWGIHTGSKSRFTDYKELNKQRFAISRLGSGSHIMPFVHAQQLGWSPADQQFVKVGNLNGAVETLTNLEADGFYWEKFTTKPLVDNGTFKRIGEMKTPWPCFVIVARNEFLEENVEAVNKMLQVIRRTTNYFMLKKEDSIAMVAERYKQQKTDVEEWFGITEWSTDAFVNVKVLETVMDTLNAVEVIEHKVAVEELIATQLVMTEKEVYDYTDKEKQAHFFETILPASLNKLKEGFVPVWGKMSAQQMVEHLGGSYYLTMGKVPLKAAVPQEQFESAKRIVLSNKDMPRNIPIPGLTNKPSKPLRFDNLELAKEKLMHALQQAIDMVATDPNHTANHPYGGPMNGEEWMVFMYKHSVHHLRQFGLIV